MYSTVVPKVFGGVTWPEVKKPGLEVPELRVVLLFLQTFKSSQRT